MGSGYYGEPNLGNERSSGGSSSSSRKGKKSSSSDKPKQPQRGLGVAQLEKIRLHGQMAGCNFVPSLHAPNYPSPNFTQEDLRMQAAYTASIPSSSFFDSSSSYGYHPNIMMGSSEFDQSSIRYGVAQSISTSGESNQSSIRSGVAQSISTSRWNPNTGIIDAQPFAQPSMTRCFLDFQAEDSLQKKRKKDTPDSMGSSSQNSESSDNQELDLELRL